jgi:ATPase subunit of ABC transporter with duplicated ATPase domains
MSSPSPRLVADGLTYQLPDGRVLLDALSLGFGRERSAVVGRNGTGKSTLVKLLAGALEPTRGRVRRHARVGWLPQDAARLVGHDASGDRQVVAHALGIADVLDALERIERGSVDQGDFAHVGDAWDIRERAALALARVGLSAIPLDRPLARISGGEATRVALARLLLEEPDVLLLDEPTNHLDADGRRAVHRLVAEWTGGVVFVSHDRALLDRADRIVELSSHGVREFGGGWRDYRDARALEDAAAERALDAAQLELRRARRDARAARERQERRNARGVRSRAEGGIPRIMLGMRKESSERTSARLAETQERGLEEDRARVMAARERVERVERIDAALPPTGLRTGDLVVELREVRWAPAPDAADIVKGAALRIDGPARVAVRGPNGSGKTTLLRLVAGELEPTGGEVRRGIAPSRIARLDQRGGLRDDDTVLDAFRRAQPALDETASRLALARFRFRADDALREVGTLSGGERLRAALACALAVVQPPKLLLLDEPTNHLDLDSVEALEEVLAGYDGALLVVSHDEAFLEAIGVERTIELRASARG